MLIFISFSLSLSPSFSLKCFYYSRECEWNAQIPHYLKLALQCLPTSPVCIIDKAYVRFSLPWWVRVRCRWLVTAIKSISSLDIKKESYFWSRNNSFQGNLTRFSVRILSKGNTQHQCSAHWCNFACLPGLPLRKLQQLALAIYLNTHRYKLIYFHNTFCIYVHTHTTPYVRCLQGEYCWPDFDVVLRWNDVTGSCEVLGHMSRVWVPWRRCSAC